MNWSLNITLYLIIAFSDSDPLCLPISLSLSLSLSLSFCLSVSLSLSLSVCLSSLRLSLSLSLSPSLSLSLPLIKKILKTPLLLVVTFLLFLLSLLSYNIYILYLSIYLYWSIIDDVSNSMHIILLISSITSDLQFQLINPPLVKIAIIYLITIIVAFHPKILTKTSISLSHF